MLRVGDQVVRIPDPLALPFVHRHRGVVVDLASSGVDPTATVRWEDGSMEYVPVARLSQVQESHMSQARKLIQEVMNGTSARQVVGGPSRSRVQEDVLPPVGTHPGATIPPTPEDPSDSYKTSFDDGGNGPHSHIVTLDAQGDGWTDEEMGSQHQVARFQVQPDPIDGHLHSIDMGVRRDVPTSLNPAGQPTSDHSLLGMPLGEAASHFTEASRAKTKLEALSSGLTKLVKDLSHLHADFADAMSDPNDFFIQVRPVQRDLIDKTFKEAGGKVSNLIEEVRAILLHQLSSR